MKKKSAQKIGTRYLIIGILLVVVALAIYVDISKPVPVRVTAITKGVIESYVEEKARTSLPHIYHVTMPLPGRILPVEVKEGDAVKKGQVVATLDDVEWKEATISAAEMLFAMKNAVDSSRAEVKASEARADYTEWILEAVKKALKTKAISERESREAEWQFLDSKVKKEESEANFHSTNALFSIAKLLPGMVERNMKRTRILSPVGGVILKVHVSNEKTMMPGAAVLDIGHLEDLEVTADVLTEEAVRIQPGDPVQIFGEAIGDRPVTGRVRRIKPKAFTQLSSLGVEQQRVAVEISFSSDALKVLDDAGRSLGLNYRVRIKVITATKPEVLIIPRTALFRGGDGAWEAFKVTGGQVGRVALKIGLMNDYQAEVMEGLEVGDRVVIAPEAALSEGLKVITSKEEGNL